MQQLWCKITFQMLHHIIITSTLFILSRTCTCPPKKDLAISYCKVSAVAHVNLISIQPKQPDAYVDIMYGIKFIKIYRMTKEFEPLANKQKLYSPSWGRMCGIAIYPTKYLQWIFFITIENNIPTINVCLPKLLWNKDSENKLFNLSKIICE